MVKEEPMEIEYQAKSEFISEESFWWLKFVPQPNIWTNVNIFRFVRLYQTYPVLWNPNNPKYSKSSEISRAYREISKKLNLRGVYEKECIKLVESLKQIYIEEKKKREEAKFHLQKYKPPPVWFQVLNDIVESIKNNEKDKTFSGRNNNEIKTEFTELIKCFKCRRDNFWTPNYLKTDLWKLFVPKIPDVIEEEKENIILNNKDISIASNNQSCEALKPPKPSYDSEFQNVLHSSSYSSQNIKQYCPDFDSLLCKCSSESSSSENNEKKYCQELNIVCNCSSESIQKVKKYCLELKNILCDCSSKSSQSIKKYCPELKNNLCNCSSDSVQKVKKYCPELKNILCDCSSKSSQSIKKYCPELKNSLCNCSSDSVQKVKKYCPEFESILCDCSSKSSQNVKKHCPEFENIVCDCPSETKSSSDSQITKDSNFRMLIDKTATPFTCTRLQYKKKYENPFEAELDRYCYYKDWNNYYNIKTCDSKEYSKEPLETEKKTDIFIFNQKPPRPHKNNILESDINLIFSDMKQNYKSQPYDCFENEYTNLREW